MQFTIRFDDNNKIDIVAKLEDASPNGSTDGPTISSAVVANEVLSDLEVDELLDIVADAIEVIAQKPRVTATKIGGFNDEERELFRKGKL